MAIIEKTDHTNFRPGETLPPKINAIANLLAVDDLFDQQRPSHANLCCWGSAELQENNFLTNPHGNGWHLNRNKFDALLIKHARQLGARIFSNCNIHSIDQEQSGDWYFILSFNNASQILKGIFAIDASGRSSTLVKRMGGKRIHHDHLIALSCIQENHSPEGSSNYTLIEAVENGWWYSADLPDNKLVVTYMTDADVYKEDYSKGQKVLQKQLAETKYTQARSEKIHSRFVLSSASSFIASKLYGTGWSAIGDAAMAYDPLSSSGISRALSDGLQVATVIPQYLAGRRSVLEEFANSFMSRYQNYLHEKKRYYSLEKRWPNAQFWKRRS